MKLPSLKTDSLYFLSDNLKNDGKYLLIASEKLPRLVNSFPFSLKSFPDSASVYRHEGVPYLVLADTLDLGQNTLDFYYGKALSSVYASHRIRLRLLPGFSASHFLVGFGLYITMKKIYMPSARSLMNCAILDGHPRVCPVSAGRLSD